MIVLRLVYHPVIGRHSISFVTLWEGVCWSATFCIHKRFLSFFFSRVFLCVVPLYVEHFEPGPLFFALETFLFTHLAMCTLPLIELSAAFHVFDRVIPNRQNQPGAYRLYMELLKRHAFSFASPIYGPNYQKWDSTFSYFVVERWVYGLFVSYIQDLLSVDLWYIAISKDS